MEKEIVELTVEEYMRLVSAISNDNMSYAYEPKVLIEYLNDNWLSKFLIYWSIEDYLSSYGDDATMEGLLQWIKDLLGKEIDHEDAW